MTDIRDKTPREIQRIIVESSTKVMLAELDLDTERDRSDMWRKHAQVENDLRGWLRLCPDTPEGHAEFYAWASHYYFDTPEPPDPDATDTRTQ